MKKITSKVTTILRENREKYEDAKRAMGGTPPGFASFGMEDMLRNPERYAHDTRGLWYQAHCHYWEKDPPKDLRQHELFVVNGESLEATYTFPDPDKPGHYRKVPQRWALAWHPHEDAVVAFKKAAQSTAAASRKMDIAEEILRRAGENTMMPLIDLVDGAEATG